MIVTNVYIKTIDGSRHTILDVKDWSRQRDVYQVRGAVVWAEYPIRNVVSFCAIDEEKKEESGIHEQSDIPF